MNRREFAKFLGLMAASAAATPAQIEAFTHYYETNMPPAPTGLVAIDDVMVCGTAKQSWPVTFCIKSRGGAGPMDLLLALNCFGGIVRWCAAPKQELLVSADETIWQIKNQHDDDGFPMEGYIKFIDQTGKRHTRVIDAMQGSLI